MSLSLLFIAKGCRSMETQCRSCGYNEGGCLPFDNQDVVATASIATTTAASVGALSVAVSAIEHTVSEFSKLKEGLKNNNSSLTIFI